MIRRMKRGLPLLASIAFGLTASAAVTYKWTGGAGNLNWNDAANWSAESGSVDMAATAAWDFTGLPTGSTVTLQSGTINVAGITFAGTGSWTLAAASGAIVKFPDTGALSSITVPSGSSLDITFPLATGNTLGSQDIRFTGKGTIRVNPSTGSFASSRKLRVTTDGTTLVIGPNWTTTVSCAFYLESTSSRLRAERDCELGALSNWGRGIVDANGHVVTFSGWSIGNNRNYQLAGSAGEFLFGSFATYNMTFDAPAMTGGRIAAYNGHANAGTKVWPSAVAVGVDDSGSISFGASQSLAALSGTGVSGAIKLGDSVSFTTTSDTVEPQTFAGRIADGADFTKAGSYDLTFEGSGTYAGRTTVNGGTLRLPAKKAVKGLWAQLLFDDPTNFGKETFGWNFTAQGDAEGLAPATSSITGKAVSFDADKLAYLKSSARPAGCMSGNGPFTIGLWVKPAPGIFNKRENSIVDLMLVGSNWDAKNMGWFYLAWSRQIFFATCDMSISYDPGNVYPFADGKWHHVATTYDGNGEQKLYLDGVCVTTKAMAHEYNFNASSPVWLGHRADNNNYAGDMDDVQFFNRCCGADEIAAEFANRRPLDSSFVAAVETKVPAPVAHYDFEDASAPGKDVSGNGYDLTAFGSWSVADCYSPSGSGRKAFVLSASGNSGLKWTGEAYPAKMPVSNRDFTLAMRYVNNGSDEGTAVAAFGDMSNHYGFFEAGINGYPLRRHVCNCWYVGENGQSLALTDTQNLNGSASGEAGWTEVIYVYTAADQTIKAYRDGHYVAEKANMDSAIWLGSKDLSIGWRSDRPTMCFKGAIDDVRIYATALTAEQVKLVARDQAGLSLAPAIPAASPVTVSAGATLAAEGDVTLHDLALAGTVTAPVRTLVALTGTANVSGQVTGGCSVTVPSGSTVALAAGRVPFADVGQLTLPESLAFTVDALPSDDGTWKTYVIATATDFVLPANFDGWTVAGLDTAKYRYGFAAENGTLTLSAKRKQGVLLILR